MASAGPARPGPTADDRATVVVADDDGDIRQLVAVAVHRAGGRVVAAVEDGQSALTAIRHHRPDLALLDVAMPALTGIQVCQAVRADDALAAVRVVLISAAAHAEAVAAGLAAQADDYICKPFSPRALAEQIRGVLAREGG